MKTLLFNIYKVCYIHINKDFYVKHPDVKPGISGQLSASAGVSMFLIIACINVWLPFYNIFGTKPLNLNKAIVWLMLIVAIYLCYLLLFKVLGLKDYNFCAPEYKPDAKTIRRTWTIFAINGAIALILLIIQVTTRKW